MAMTYDVNLPKLTPNSIKRILDGENISNVTVQVLGYKRVPDRFRLLLNDGETLFPFAVLSTPLNHLIEDKKLEKFTIIKLAKYACVEVKGSKKVILCLEIQSLLPGSAVNNQICLSNSPSSTALPSMSNNFAESLNCSVKSFPNFLPSTMPFPNHNQSLREELIQANACNSTATNYVCIRDNGSNVSLKTGTASHESSTVPLSSLTPYLNKWTIKARVIYKTNIVAYTNQRGNGKFFSFYLLDETGEMKSTAFNEQAEFLQEFLQLNKVYFMSGALVKPSKENCGMKFGFEITVTENTRIELVDDAHYVPSLKFNFMPISQIKSIRKDSYIDVIGICCSVSNIKTILNKTNNKEIHKIDVIVMDYDKNPITLSVWGSEALGFKSEVGSIIAVRNAKVTDYAGCALSLSPISMLFINPSILEAFKLKTWFDNLSDTFNFQSITNNSMTEWQPTWKTFNEITDELDKVEYFTVKASIIMVQKDKCLYRACPAEDCFKKVTCLENGLYQCSKCGQEYDNFKWTLLLTINLADSFGSHWVVAFKDTAEALVGYTAEELVRLQEENEDAFLDVLSNMHFKSYIFKLRSKVEVYNETSRLKITILNAKPLDLVPYTKKLMSSVIRFQRILSVNEVLE